MLMFCIDVLPEFLLHANRGNKWNRDLVSAHLSAYLLLLPLAFTAYIRQKDGITVAIRCMRTNARISLRSWVNLSRSE
jgi:hypothetical protein